MSKSKPPRRKRRLFARPVRLIPWKWGGKGILIKPLTPDEIREIERRVARRDGGAEQTYAADFVIAALFDPATRRPIFTMRDLPVVAALEPMEVALIAREILRLSGFGHILPELPRGGARVTAAEMLIRVAADGVDVTVRDLRSVDSQLARTADHSMRLGRTFSTLGRWARRAFVGIAVGAAGVLGYGLKIGSDMEQAAIGFASMLGSGERAEKFLKRLFDFAARTPFTFESVRDGARSLLGMGFAAGQVLPVLTDIGNAVAAMGGGEEMVDRVTRAIGQMNAKGVVSAEEMRQLAEAGIPAWQMLADAIGVSVPEAMKLVEQRAVSAETFLAAFHTGVASRFGDAMKKQSKSLLGLFSTMKDTIAMKLADTAGPLVTSLKAAMPVITKLVGDLLDTAGPVLVDLLTQLGTGLVELLPTMAPVLQSLASLFVQLLAAAIPVVQAALPALAEVLTAIAPHAGELAQGLAQLVIAVIPLIPPLAQLAIQVLPAFTDALNIIVPVIAPLIGALSSLVNWVSNKVPMGFVVMTAGLVTLLGPIGLVVSAVILLISKLGELQAAAATAFDYFYDAEGVANEQDSIQNLADATAAQQRSLANKVPGMSRGGIVTKPTLALIGEGSEPEAVVPLSRLSSMARGDGLNTTTRRRRSRPNTRIEANVLIDGQVLGRVKRDVEVLMGAA